MRPPRAAGRLDQAVEQRVGVDQVFAMRCTAGACGAVSAVISAFTLQSDQSLFGFGTRI